ncbi:phosphatidylserine decarboxylase-domain-containing protein [Epithele typhae]|uniref:phosphatidylserine decarboxylase-domain-containing protein n=1 Tax=Epithele typhae TaxID=378194 RepID=UPI002007B4ED|nr:phosphatidylserine decarboxylase-domain-containing protein [Epithele typhae]KAH9923440.1 phosphatidylserine decarboxylase-domain-containing protein [Epithele typhae]
MTHFPIVQELVDKMAAEPDFKAEMEMSWLVAYNTPGLDIFNELNVHSLDEYIDFMDKYLHWVPLENQTGTNRPPWQWLSDWLVRYALEMGKWMSTPESITPEHIATFYAAPSYHMQDYPVPIGGWTTFNNFFCRHIDPAVRPIASPNDDTVIVSPADCSFDGTWPVRDPEADVNSFDVKGIEWKISQLLADFSGDVGALFAGGVFTHSFLGPEDYHRQHAPVAGTVVQAEVISGICYLEVGVTETPGKSGKVQLGMHRYLRRRDDPEIPKKHRTYAVPSAGAGGGAPTSELDAPDTPGYQFLQARGLVLIDNPVLGLVAVLPIGMAQVSSVLLSVQKGETVEKGQEISWFELGGSDIVMVFQKGANVQFEQTVGTHYNYGTRVATGGSA